MITADTAITRPPAAWARNRRTAPHMTAKLAVTILAASLAANLLLAGALLYLHRQVVQLQGEVVQIGTRPAASLQVTCGQLGRVRLHVHDRTVSCTNR
jgi:hypothetical protein